MTTRAAMTTMKMASTRYNTSAVTIIKRFKRTSPTPSKMTSTKKAARLALSKKRSTTATTSSTTTAATEPLYGLRPIDYTIPPSISATPPPPPFKKGSYKPFAFPAVASVVLGIAVYFAYNNKNDAEEYWRAMQEGGTLVWGDDDDDDDDDEEEEEEEGNESK
mmetsp:Transcript_23909/g.34775  ORF Transcript_23909/g.34775 Transcript_23909/m.34775 type:complete len:163 (+) Transcript_23909:210-698(+)